MNLQRVPYIYVKVSNPYGSCSGIIFVDLLDINMDFELLHSES